jgi:hypothetical protein
VRFFPYLILLLSLSRILAAPLDLPWLDRFGRHLAIAPSPKPFQSVRTSWSDSYESRVQMRCYQNGEPRDWRVWSHEFHAAIEGPHRRYVIFLNFITNLNQYKNEPYLPILRRGFCVKNPFGAALGCEDPNQIHAQFPFFEPGKGIQLTAVALPCK